MKVLFENWRRFIISEVSMEQAFHTLKSKKMQKVVRAYNYAQGRDPEFDMRHYIQLIGDYILESLPTDISDNQKGTAILWLAKQVREIGFERYMEYMSMGQPGYFLRGDLEYFFNYQEFMPERDLMKLKFNNRLQRDERHTLTQIVVDGRLAVEAYQEQQEYEDAEAGTEILFEDDKWLIAALHNKGAACELGKNTAWCTAAPGLDYFGEYYEAGVNPLFFFENKKTGERFQFFYGKGGHFMDADDRAVSQEVFSQLHSLLAYKTRASMKYRGIRKYENLQQGFRTWPIGARNRQYEIDIDPPEEYSEEFST